MLATRLRGALLLVTHDEDLAQRCTSRRWTIENGRVEVSPMV